MYNCPILSQLSEEATISILTCKPGSEIYSMYGHTAIRISDPVTKKDQIYNYGLFSFNEPNFTIKFLRGKLLYHLGVTDINRFAYQYTQQKRSIIEQVLDLKLDQRNAVYKALQENMKPENKSYKYDFFFDNCSTRIFDILKDHIVGLQYPEAPEKRFTFRELLDEYTYNWPWTDFGQDLIVGSVSDAEAKVKGQAFLPEFFYDILERSSIGHKPLVSETNLILDFEAEDAVRRKKVFQTPIWLFIALMLLELIFLIRHSKKALSPRWLKWLDSLWFLILGIGGLIILFMWFGTDHLTTKMNLNLLWMSPLFIILLFKKSAKLIGILLGLLGLSMVLSLFLQDFHVCAIIIICTTIIKLMRHFRRIG